jgi:hypothetical protein
VYLVGFITEIYYDVWPYKRNPPIQHTESAETCNSLHEMEKKFFVIRSSYFDIIRRQVYITEPYTYGCQILCHYKKLYTHPFILDNQFFFNPNTDLVACGISGKLRHQNF